MEKHVDDLLIENQHVLEKLYFFETAVTGGSTIWGCLKICSKILWFVIEEKPGKLPGILFVLFFPFQTPNFIWKFAKFSFTNFSPHASRFYESTFRSLLPHRPHWPLSRPGRVATGPTVGRPCPGRSAAGSGCSCAAGGQAPRCSGRRRAWASRRDRTPLSCLELGARGCHGDVIWNLYENYMIWNYMECYSI